MSIRVYTILLVLCSVALGFVLRSFIPYKKDTYILPRYGEYCYHESNAPKTIKYPILFDSISECLKAKKEFMIG